MKLPATEKINDAYDWIRKMFGLKKPQPPIIPDKPKKKKVKKPPQHNGFDVLIQKEHLPKYMRLPEVRGVFIGSCIRKQDRRWRIKDAQAHAHTGNDWCKGFICIPDSKVLKRHATMRHEVAHLLSTDGSNQGHNLNWAANFIELCGGRYKYITIEWLAKKYKFKVEDDK
jgi:hypothetical protein